MKRTRTTPATPSRRDALAFVAQALLVAATGCAAQTRPGLEVKMANIHPNVQAIERLFAAYAAKDVAKVRDILAPDVVWRIPGHHPLSGEKRGVTEVLAFFDQLAKANFDHHRGWSDVAGGLDMTWCLVFRFEAGRIKEVTNFAFDQHKADVFFWTVYRLKPIPDRLES
jgi:ketosteroid isomerase-like protein